MASRLRRYRVPTTPRQRNCGGRREASRRMRPLPDGCRDPWAPDSYLLVAGHYSPARSPRAEPLRCFAGLNDVDVLRVLWKHLIKRLMTPTIAAEFAKLAKAPAGADTALSNTTTAESWSQ